MIAYGSHTLSRPERHYCGTRRELLAAVTFISQFQPYLLDHVFQLCTDHGSHTWLTNFKEPEGQLALWLECLQEFTFQTIHHPGKSHTSADALSHRPCSQCGREEHQLSDKCAVDEADGAVVAFLNEHSPQHLREPQLDDPTIGPVLQAVEKDERLNPDTIVRGGPEVRCLIQLWDWLLVEEGV